ncbi:FMN-dependent NADH-azoreductase [Nitrincola sp. MINF-07-Sa-05]|uniref:FMN-dependent NADH-azoreductase n=1 Tax=Nitrincola salilacus TaxID=3400273 RepID=UPI003917ED20
MKTLLHVKSSLFAGHGQSTQLADKFIAQWLESNPDGQVVTRDLVKDQLPHLDAELVAALMSDPAQRTEQQQAVVDLSDSLIDELKQADQVLIGVPMYNFGVPSQMKSWLDLLARSGVTFRYTETGPVGLLQDKPVVLLATRGGLYKESGMDHQIPFLKQILGFVGFKSVEVVYAEGLNMGDGVKEQALTAAQEQVTQLAS